MCNSESVIKFNDNNNNIPRICTVPGCDPQLSLSRHLAIYFETNLESGSRAMASSATSGLSDFVNVHSPVSAISTGEIKVEDNLQVCCHVAALGDANCAYFVLCLLH